MSASPAASSRFAVSSTLTTSTPASGRGVSGRFPRPASRAARPWPATAWERGGAPTWLSGSYDPELNTLYWGTGNPNPDFYGDSRTGDNLYSGSLIALDADSGKLKWHFQFTPHDTHDWDANQIPVLADLTIARPAAQGRAWSPIATASSTCSIARPENSSARSHSSTRRGPRRSAPTGGRSRFPTSGRRAKGTLTCPDLFGGTNFMSPSFDPSTGLMYVSARETCQIYIAEAPPEGYKAGDRTMGGRVGRAPGLHAARRAPRDRSAYRRAEMGDQAPGAVLGRRADHRRRCRVHRTPTKGYVFAADSKTGKELWRYQAGAPIYAPPTTYQIDGRQYVVMPCGHDAHGFCIARCRDSDEIVID